MKKSLSMIATSLQEKVDYHKNNIPNSKPIGWISSKSYIKQNKQSSY